MEVLTTCTTCTEDLRDGLEALFEFARLTRLQLVLFTFFALCFGLRSLRFFRSCIFITSRFVVRSEILARDLDLLGLVVGGALLDLRG